MRIDAKNRNITSTQQHISLEETAEPSEIPFPLLMLLFATAANAVLLFSTRQMIDKLVFTHPSIRRSIASLLSASTRITKQQNSDPRILFLSRQQIGIMSINFAFREPISRCTHDVPFVVPLGSENVVQIPGIPLRQFTLCPHH